MTAFRVSTYMQGVGLPQQLMARFELAGWLTGRGETTLAKLVCNAATPEGLAPHLAKVDTIIKDAQPQDIFRSARFFASGDMPTDTVPSAGPDISKLREQLAGIGEHMQARILKGKKLEGRKLIKRIEKALVKSQDGEDGRAILEGLILEGHGYLLGVGGSELDLDMPRHLIAAPAETNDPWIYTARLFIDAIRSGHVEHRGTLNPEHQWLADTFINGALDVWDLRLTKNQVPEFLETTGRYWARAQGMLRSTAVEKYTQHLGSGFGRYILPRLRLALVSGLARSKVMTSIHLIDPQVFIFGRGWLAGHADAMRTMGDVGMLLAANCSSIVYRALVKRDAGYMSRAALLVPKMLGALDTAVVRLAQEGDNESADAILVNRGRAS